MLSNSETINERAVSSDSFSQSLPGGKLLQVIHKDHFLTSVLGDVNDLWEPTVGDNLSPAFEHGAGIVLEDFLDEIEQSVEMVATEPYKKSPPPTGLPLDTLKLKVIFEKGKTGFEKEKEFPITKDSVVAGRYRIEEFVDSASFSRTACSVDLETGRQVCLKIIHNSKENFDQSLDEVKLLTHVNEAGDPDENSFLQLYDYFYYKEHMFIVTEILADNLYQFSKYNRHHEEELYFTLPRVQSIARQVLTALRLIHSLNIIHCDLKPENILFKSYSKCLVKVIDFGSSCYFTDVLSSYVQSRCYRAPEVILGCRYDDRVDVWSLGAILAELATGKVLFENDTVASMLALVTSVSGPIPSRMLHEGRNTPYFVTKHGAFYENIEERLVFHFPEEVSADAARLGFDDAEYLDFVRQCLTMDPLDRPSASELLTHPFITKPYN
ncbi:protein kinase [Angomonas deanei]|nr:protein kinase [Angomonas deanei]EPY41462.1 protein kinase [Angomonas deanei]|eukprot:EPY36266.1 protein kinase [Angomonas deanei]